MKNKIKFLVVLVFMFSFLFLVACGGEGNNENNKKENKAEIVASDIEVGVKKEVDLDYMISGGTALSFEFISEDDEIATVDDFGTVKGVEEGDTVITIVANLADGSYITKDINVTVVDSLTYIIQFQLAGGKCDVEYGEVLPGGSYTLPIPTKENAEFLGWTVSGSTGYVTKLTNINKNMTVRANWLNTYTLKYELNGGATADGSALTSSLVKEGTSIKLPTLIKEGNTFLGWAYSKNATSYMTEIANLNSNCIIYAQWRPAQIDVTFDLDGGYYNGAKYLTYDGSLVLGAAQKPNYEFVGWTLEKGSTQYVTELNNVKSAVKLYANFVENSLSAECIITNLPMDGIPYNTDFQLQYAFYGTNKKTVEFSTKDTQIIKISTSGLITALRPGVATIKVDVKENTNMSQTIEVEVYKPGRFDVSYETVSYMKLGETIKLNSKYYDKHDALVDLSYKSLNPDCASVDNYGVVKGLKSGNATIRCFVTNNEDIYFDYGVTVVPGSISDGLKLVLSSHESNVFTRYGLNIGWTYDTDIIGSVTDLFYNHEYTVNRDYEALAAQNGVTYGKKKSTELITVHYTGNMSKNANGLMHAKYFANGSGGAGTSIQYCTGNDGVFSCTADDLIAVHAGDGVDPDAFKWNATGVMYKEGDPKYPVFGISSNSKFTLNGEETKINVPTGTTPETARVTSDYYSAAGKQIKCINDMGIAFKVENGEYFIGSTYWSYGHTATGLICNRGGNANSIGIESAVDLGSDIWLTWHITAQLVAHLLVENDLPTTRVFGHYFYSGKLCPQPMLENDLECWWKFMEMVESEYEKLTTCKDYEFIYSSQDNGNSIRATQGTESQLITYTVRVNKGSTSEVVTLNSIIKGTYLK